MVHEINTTEQNNTYIQYNITEKTSKVLDIDMIMKHEFYLFINLYNICIDAENTYVISDNYSP